MKIYRLSARRFTFALSLLLMVIALPSASFAATVACTGPSDKKVALVIGSSYSGADQVSGVEDASAISEYLCEMDFSVLLLLDGKTQAITDSLDELRARIANSEIVVFFYSGHGYQINGANFLLPVGTAIDPADPQAPLEEVFRRLSGAPDGAVKLVLLDACRSNVNLKVSGGGVLGGVPGWSPGLGKPSSAAPPRTLFGFAASFGRTAASGQPDEISPYTSALLRSIREPGLEIRQFLLRVRDDVFVGTRRRQAPKEEGLANIPEPFYLRDPVFVPAAIPQGNFSNLLVVLNGQMVLDSTQKPQDRLRLKAGENDLFLLVSSGKTYRNGHTWERTEGWKYHLDLTLPNGVTVPFEDSEDAPFKDGPHHGKVFTVAKAKILVDPTSAETTLPANSLDVKIWNQGIPLWAQDQELLYEKRVKDLDLDRILDPAALPAANLGILPGQTIVVLLRELLKTGTLLGKKIADPEQTFFVVRGNEAFKGWARTCVEARMDDRIKDLRASVEAAIRRDPRPFDSFDQALTACVKDLARQEGDDSLPLDDIKVWTAIEDRRGEAPLAASGGFHG